MRHGSEPYLCRYRGCPRAIQGFNSSDLRQQHENSHVPLFRCNDAACEILGKGLTSRAAMNRHNKKYHDDNCLAAIPTSLRKASAHPQQDRLRFLLKEPSSNSRKRESHVLEEDNVFSEVDGTTTSAHSIQDLASLPADALMMDRIFKCICLVTGHEDHEAFRIIHCDSCHTAQHIRCYYVDEHDELLEVEEHFCIDCKPRPIDARLANNRQIERIEQYVHKLSLYELARKEAKEIIKDFKKDGTGASTVPRSVREEHLLRAFISHHGTDWVANAQGMGMRGHHEVCSS